MQYGRIEKHAILYIYIYIYIYNEIEKDCCRNVFKFNKERYML